jgi:hypothetical protein
MYILLLFVDTLRINATIVTTTGIAITTSTVTDTTSTPNTATTAVLIAIASTAAAAVNLPPFKRAPEDEGCRKSKQCAEIQCRVK